MPLPGFLEKMRELCDKYGQERWRSSFYRAYLLHGTDAGNLNPKTHEFYNRAHRVRRRMERDQLRPHLVQDEDFYFDDSHAIQKYKGVWWEIY